MRERLWVALDVDTVKEAETLLERLAGVGVGAKIGSQLYTAAGPAAVEMALHRGVPVFLDLKYHDIPNTVAGAVREATRLGVAMLNVHAAGGSAMLRAAAEAATRAAQDFKVTRPIVLGVTVLTSLDRQALDEVGVAGTVEAHVLRLAEVARVAGLDGCVASPQEIRPLRVALGAGWVIVTPGVRPDATPVGGPGGSLDRGAPTDDQKRVATPRAAIGAGADAIVIGRPITAAGDPGAAARAILEEIAAAGN
ncbi:MAG TPA: orotidine-5'-phosphate decarboxylase [Methylomirabilota bacterium]|nr:orotidine-5'-phosphate decarboxylase [Methylomirabilota bacterium]